MGAFTKLANKAVVYTTDNGTVFGIKATSYVLPHPQNNKLIMISDDANPQETDKGLFINWESITGITATDRNDMILKLMTDFFFPSIASSSVTFDNTGTKLNSTDIQSAVSEIDRRAIDMAEPSGFLRNQPLTNGVIELSPDGITVYSVDENGAFSQNTSGNFANGTAFQTPALARQFAIHPANGEGDYLVYIQGLLYQIANIQVVTIPNTTGLNYIHHDEDGTLMVADTLDPDYFNRTPIVSAVYGNATHQELIVFGDERHGIEMPGSTHKYLHFTDGTRYVSGMAVTGLAAGLTTFIAIEAGRAYDEDIIMNFLEQPVAQNWFMDASGWRTVPDSNILGYTEGGNTNVSYNEEIATGSFQLTEITSNDFMAVHFLATNNVTSPYVKILGQKLYATAGTARSGIFEEINNLQLEGLPTPEFTFIASVIINKSGELVLQTDGKTHVDLRRPPRSIYDTI